MERQGGRRDIERACDRLAEGGYAALMPDLFGDGFTPLCVARSMRQIASGRGPSVDVIHAAPGGINESDVMLAAASDAIIVGFNVRPLADARTCGWGAAGVCGPGVSARLEGAPREVTGGAVV